MKKIFVVAAFITSQLSAQDTTLLSDVTISATKYATKTTETGKVVVIINRQQIDQAGARDLSQLLNEQGGVFISGANGSPGKDKNIYLRGAKFDYTLITIDGVPVYDASGIGSNFDLRQIPIDLVERVEILKGSQGTLYGSDAIAGVINIITRKGESKPLNIQAGISAGSINGARTNTYLTPDSYKFNLGIGGKKERVDYHVALTRYITDGISEAIEAGFNTPRFEEDSFKQTSLDARIGFTTKKGNRFQPYFRYAAIRAELDQDAFIDEKDFTSENDNVQAGFQHQMKFGKADLRLLYNFNNTSREYTDDSTETDNGYFRYSKYLYRSSEHYGEAFIVYPFNQFKLTSGIDLRTAAADYSYTTVSKSAPPFFPSTTTRAEQGRDSTRHRQAGLYAAFHFNPRAGLSLETGGRLNLHSEYGGHAAYNINPSYFVAKRVKLFANLSTGYKTPSLYHLYSEFGNEDLKPETSVNLEGGLQLFSKDGRANVRGTYFRRQVKDVINFFYDMTTFQAKFINQDKQKDNGYELDLALRASEKLNVKVFYSHVDGEVETKFGGKDTSYSNLIRRPKNSLSLHMGSQLSPKFFLSAQAQYVGEAKDLYFNSFTFTTQEVKLEKYVLLHLYAEYKLMPQMRFFADLRNLTDEKYTEVYGYNTPGFNWHAGLRWQF